MADIRHVENREIAIFQRKNHPISMKFVTQMHVCNSVTVT